MYLQAHILRPCMLSLGITMRVENSLYISGKSVLWLLKVNLWRIVNDPINIGMFVRPYVHM